MWHCIKTYSQSSDPFLVLRVALKLLPQITDFLFFITDLVGQSSNLVILLADDGVIILLLHHVDLELCDRSF